MSRSEVLVKSDMFSRVISINPATFGASTSSHLYQICMVPDSDALSSVAVRVSLMSSSDRSRDSQQFVAGPMVSNTGSFKQRYTEMTLGELQSVEIVLPRSEASSAGSSPPFFVGVIAPAGNRDSVTIDWSRVCVFIPTGNNDFSDIEVIHQQQQ
jgi:hypothetical protein